MDGFIVLCAEYMCESLAVVEAAALFSLSAHSEKKMEKRKSVHDAVDETRIYSCSTFFAVYTVLYDYKSNLNRC